MYWIEIHFDNGKTIKRQYDNINESYAVYCRYCCGATNPKRKVIKVIAGCDERQTFECNH